MSPRAKFNTGNEAAARMAAKRAAKMVTNVSKSTEKALRTVITSSLRKGLSTYDTARLIKTLIGLTAPQSQAALTYRQSLIDAGLPLDKVVKATDRYADKLLTDRGENIARTEVMEFLNSGQEAAWHQAQEEGLLSPTATKGVVLSHDPCEKCIEIAARGPVPIAEEFDEDGPPFHNRCECTIEIVDA